MGTHMKRQSPPVGTRHKKRYKRKEYQMVVVRTKDGVGYSVSGKVYESVSAAAKSITNNEVNGWRFWHID